MGESNNRSPDEKSKRSNPCKGRSVKDPNRIYTTEDLRSARERAFEQGVHAGSEVFLNGLGLPKHTALSTPSSRWAEEGAGDPHDHKFYLNAERATLTLGDHTDDELANGVFMHGDPDDAEKRRRLMSGEIPSIAWLTAGKERIRWLSRQLEAALEANRQFADRMEAIWSLLLDSPQGTADLEIEARKVLPGYFVDTKLEEMKVENKQEDAQ